MNDSISMIKYDKFGRTYTQKILMTVKVVTRRAPGGVSRISKTILSIEACEGSNESIFCRDYLAFGKKYFF